MAVLGGTFNARFRERLRFRDKKRVRPAVGNIGHFPRTSSVSKRCGLLEMEDLRNGDCFPCEGIQAIYSTRAGPIAIPISYLGRTRQSFVLERNAGKRTRKKLG